MKRFAILAVLCAACVSSPRIPESEPNLPPDVEAMSLLGRPLRSPQLAPDVQKQREEQLAQALRDYAVNRDNVEAAMLVADRLANLGRYRKAIEVLSEALQRHPDDARLYRLRGHRYINVRRLRDAVTDLEKAKAQPNAELQQILYHLGLAYYLQGDFDHALAAYRRALTLSKDSDRLVATSYWAYVTLRRLGRVQEAEKLLEPISIDLDVKENVSYHKLLLMYESEIAPEELMRQDPNATDGATILYGIGNWYFINGQSERALPLWQKVLDGNQTFAFSYIAAEAEMARVHGATAAAASAASSRTTGYFPVKQAVQ